MTLEELAKWHDEKADSFAQKAGEMYRGSHARAMWKKQENMFRTSAAACRELIDKRGGFCDMCSREIESTTDRLLKECK